MPLPYRKYRFLYPDALTINEKLRAAFSEKHHQFKVPHMIMPTEKNILPFTKALCYLETK